MNNSSPCGGQVEASGRRKDGEAGGEAARVGAGGSRKSAPATAIKSLDFAMGAAMSSPLSWSCHYHNELFRT
jgi:hypothetical protein